MKSITAAVLAALLAVPATAQIGYGAGSNYDPGNGPNRGYGYGDNGYGGGRRETITCESLQFRPNRCPADTGGGVRIVQQLGNNSCIQGRTWGYDRGGIWVDNGCRAVFATSGGRPGWGPGGPGGYPGGGYPGGPGGPGGPGRVITCSSNNYQPSRCPVDVYRGAQLVEDFTSKNLCSGRNWGWDRGGVWVNNGCRGRFRVY